MKNATPSSISSATICGSEQKTNNNSPTVGQNEASGQILGDNSGATIKHHDGSLPNLSLLRIRFHSSRKSFAGNSSEPILNAPKMNLVNLAATPYGTGMHTHAYEQDYKNTTINTITYT